MGVLLKRIEGTEIVAVQWGMAAKRVGVSEWNSNQELSRPDERRHNEIWPEMVEALKQAGICNYTIFVNGNELFGYYECEKGIAYAERIQAESPVVDRWNAYMQDVLDLEMNPETGAQPKLEAVFRLE